MSDSSPSGGTPPIPDEQYMASQEDALRAVVADAFRLLPPGAGGVAGAGAGQGEGVSPQVISAMVRSLLDLRTLTGGDGIGVLDWLSTGLGTAPPGDAGDTTAAALRIRDLLLDGFTEVGEEQPNGLEESEESVRAAEVFASGSIQVAEP